MLGAHGGLEWTCFRVQTPIGKKYHVQNGDCDEVAIVSSIDKAIPVLLDYYDKHPTRWQRYDHSYSRQSRPAGGSRMVGSSRSLRLLTAFDAGWQACNLRNN